MLNGRYQLTSSLRRIWSKINATSSHSYIMDRTNRVNLVSSALRVYLTHVLHETEDLLKGYKLRERLCTPGSGQFSQWGQIISAATRVLTYIQNCQQDGRLFGFHALCAIEAAQDALSSSIYNAKSCPLTSPTRGILDHFHHLTQENTFRAKCFANSVVALNHQDSELAALWVKAAQYVLAQSQLRYPEARGKDWSVQSIPDLACLSKAAALANQAAKESSVEVSDLQIKAAKCFRRAAVHAVLGYGTNYRFAAETFEIASTYMSIAMTASGAVETLWRKAAHAMHLAGDQIERQAVKNTAKVDSTVRETIKIAKDFASEADKMMIRLAELKKIKCQSFAFDTQVTCALPMWQALKAHREKVESLWECYVQCDLSSIVAMEFLTQYIAAKEQLVVVSAAAEKLELSIERANFYRTQAHKYDHVQSDALRTLWQQSWSNAASLTDRVVQMDTLAVIKGAYIPLNAEIMARKQAVSMRARMYVFCAETILHWAVSYSNSARGAEASQRDSREAEWWRDAAACQLQAVTQYLHELVDVTEVPRNEHYIPALSPTVCKAVERANMFVRAIDYLDRSRRFVVWPKQSEWTRYVPLLYALAAELITDKSCGKLGYHTTTERAESSCRVLIDKLTDRKREWPVDLVPLSHMLYTYGTSLLETSRTSATLAAKWRSALDACLDAIHWVGCPYGRFAKASACAELHACSARAHSAGDVHSCIALAHTAQLLHEALCQEGGYFQAKMSSYRTSLAQRLCGLYSEVVEIPVEVASLPCLPSDTETDNLLRYHLIACQAEIECAHQLSLFYAHCAEGIAWAVAADQAKELGAACMSLANCIDKEHRERFLGLIAVNEVSLRCCLSAARTMSSIWDAAMAMYHDTSTVRHQRVFNNRVDSQNAAIIALERHIDAAEAFTAGDHELASLRADVARSAGRLFRVHDEGIVGQDFAEHDLKAAESRVLAILAERATQPELAALHMQLAELYTECRDCFVPHANLSKKLRMCEAKIETLLVRKNDLESAGDSAAICAAAPVPTEVLHGSTTSGNVSQRRTSWWGRTLRQLFK